MEFDSTGSNLSAQEGEIWGGMGQIHLFVVTTSQEKGQFTVVVNGAGDNVL